ncbi:MAG: hypothetical protein H6574_17030 [Lewinellaceae bacterium]|nr:hypothetical protein [Saprospiraceae bacterium]MCB9316671.1 hypothetical protein [Lewinellaceae bacterium]MCB9332778.1 hypothetical protein [Lewinellaceae bacterium]
MFYAGEKEKFIANWEKRRAKGKWHFILRNTFWTTLLFIAVMVLVELVSEGWETILNGAVFYTSLWFTAIFFGFFMAWSQWSASEGQYRKLKSGV